MLNKAGSFSFHSLYVILKLSQVKMLNRSGSFTFHLLHVLLKLSQVKCPYRKFWFIKIPLKIKVFLWLMVKNSILTKDNLLTGSVKCMFCSDLETVDHLFMQCPIARNAWWVVGCAFKFDMNLNSASEFCGWIFSFPVKFRGVVAVGVAAVLWALLKTRNAEVFHSVFPYDPTNIITQRQYWLSYLVWYSETRTTTFAGQRDKAATASCS